MISIRFHSYSGRTQTEGKKNSKPFDRHFLSGGDRHGQAACLVNCSIQMKNLVRTHRHHSLEPEGFIAAAVWTSCTCVSDRLWDLEAFADHRQPQSNVSMSPRTESARGGFAGNRSLIGAVCWCAARHACVCVPPHSWHQHQWLQIFFTLTEFLCFLLPWLCFYFFSRLCIRAFFFCSQFACFSFPFFTHSFWYPALLCVFPTIFLHLTPSSAFSLPLLTDLWTGEAAVRPTQAAISLEAFMASPLECLHCNTWSLVKKEQQKNPQKTQLTFVAARSPTRHPPTLPSCPSLTNPANQVNKHTR